MLKPYITPPPYSPDLSPQDYFLFSKLKMKLKRFHFADVAEIQEAVNDESKKDEISAAFQKLYERANPVYMSMEIILNFKKRHVSSTFKKPVLKLLGRTV